MSNPVIVVHYHELWLKGGNRRFFLGKLITALRKALQGIPVERIEQPGDRFVVWLGDGASLQEVTARVDRVMGIAYYAVARAVERNMEAMCKAAWEEMEPLRFETFAVRAKRSDKTISARRVMEMEVNGGTPPAGKIARAKSQRARAIERAGNDLPRGNTPRAWRWFTRGKFPAQEACQRTLRGA